MQQEVGQGFILSEIWLDQVLWENIFKTVFLWLSGRALC